jgi:ketosteroid isomerase-like protein
MSAEVQDLAVRYGAAWADRDVNAITAMHTDDTVYHLHGGGEPAIGVAATREAFQAALAQWPDLGFERTQVYFGDRHFVSQYRMSATAEGRRIVCDGVDVFAVEDGKISRKDTYLDWPAIQDQLAPPAPTTASA